MEFALVSNQADSSLNSKTLHSLPLDCRSIIGGVVGSATRRSN